MPVHLTRYRLLSARSASPYFYYSRANDLWHFYLLSVIEIIQEDTQSNLEGVVKGVEFVVCETADCYAPTRCSLLHKGWVVVGVVFGDVRSRDVLAVVEAEVKADAGCFTGVG